jgi:poly(3-hydroxybutyrate) depolymerase
VTTELTIPTCKTSAEGYPSFDDSPPLEWADVNGDDRAACVYTPAAASKTSPRPLLVFLHGHRGSADSVYDETLLRQKAASFDLSGDAARPGFILAALQGRNLSLAWEPTLGGPHFDQWYRDLGSPSCNPDVRSLDRLIDDLVAKGSVDRKQIYLSGWSNGAFMAAEYGIAREKTPTPGGNLVAAVAAYAGADPFNNLLATQTPSCQLSRYPSTTLPFLMVHRDCDALVGCDAAQLAEFELPPGGDVEDWLDTLRSVDHDSTVAEVLIDAQGMVAAACQSATTCTMPVGLANHLDWPDGVSDEMDWEPVMLGFLQKHPGD